MSKRVERVIGCMGLLIGVGLGMWFFVWVVMNYVK